MSLISALWWNLLCLLYEISKLVTYLTNFLRLSSSDPALFSALDGKLSLFGSFGWRLEQQGISG